jgi:glycosyltransferase involved in cell wall biosynthesis
MKVLHVVTKSEHGGAQTHVWQLALHLRQAGHSAHITAYPGGWLEAQAAANGIPFHPNGELSNSFNPAKGVAAGKRIVRLVRDLRPDVVHCHSSAAGFWARLAIKGSTPTIFTAHGWGFMPGAPWLRRRLLLMAEKRVARFTAHYICVSERDGRLAMAEGIATEERLSIIHNGVEIHHSGPRALTGDATIRAIFVGRLARPKEPEVLISALSELPETVRGAYELQIVGDGPMLAQLRGQVSRSPARVSLLGALSRDEVLRALSESQLFILVSRYEGFPVSILEAMSMGLALIASDVGGVGEAVTPECGILMQRGDKEALKRALTRFAEDRQIIGRFGAAARERARREFSVTAMCEKTLAVYESVLRQ